MTAWSSKGDPRRRGQPVHLEGPRSLGLHEWHHSGFQSSGYANRRRDVESFNATVRSECLGRCWFLDLDDAREKVEELRIEYDEVRLMPQ